MRTEWHAHFTGAKHHTSCFDCNIVVCLHLAQSDWVNYMHCLVLLPSSWVVLAPLIPCTSAIFPVSMQDIVLWCLEVLLTLGFRHYVGWPGPAAGLSALLQETWQLLQPELPAGIATVKYNALKYRLGFDFCFFCCLWSFSSIFHLSFMPPYRCTLFLSPFRH